MKLYRTWILKTLVLPGFISCTIPLLPTPTLSKTATNSTNQVRPPLQDQLHLAQRRQCPKQAGPFATQTTAWQRWREAKSQGYAVSNGVVTCFDQNGTRGYCFKIFFPC